MDEVGVLTVQMVRYSFKREFASRNLNLLPRNLDLGPKSAGE